MEESIRQYRPMVINAVREGTMQEQYRPVRLLTNRGEVQCRYYPVPTSHRGAIWVGGVGGGWDTPARGLYPHMCLQLAEQGIASLRVRFRYPTDLEEAVLDVLAGAAFLQGEGIYDLALTGHSFGGAVVIEAAAGTALARTVVTLSTQSYGADRVAELAPRCSILLIHGQADTVLPPSSSRHVYEMAGQPKRLIIYPGAGHGLDEAADAVHAAVREWITDRLGVPAEEAEEA